jgi:hypothetical protein
MAIAAVPLFTSSFETQLDDLLMRICVELQLDETRRKLAETSYQAAGEWLESQELVARLRPTIYPQGSVLLDTTVKPLVGDEYDLDLVCELACATSFFASPVDALDLIERVLRSNRVYEPLIERMNRCIRLNYARKFHLDILPACRDLMRGGTCILVPDRRLQNWTPSNPKGFGSWFDEKARKIFLRMTVEKAAPIPEQQPARSKPPLKLCVQLWKRARDIHYRNNADAAPISVVLTTIAGLVYRGEQSVNAALGHILEETVKAVGLAQPRLIVLNPSNQGEDLSERWDSKPQAYREFVRGVTDFEARWKALSNLRGIDKAARALEQLFGEDLTRTVIEKQTRDVETARKRNELGAQKRSGILGSLAAGSAVAVRPNTFYGEET